MCAVRESSLKTVTTSDQVQPAFLLLQGAFVSCALLLRATPRAHKSRSLNKISRGFADADDVVCVAADINLTGSAKVALQKWRTPGREILSAIPNLRCCCFRIWPQS